MSRLSAFNLTHTDEEYIHWTYNVPSSKESSQPAESSTMKGKVIIKEQLANFKIILKMSKVYHHQNKMFCP